MFKATFYLCLIDNQSLKPLLVQIRPKLDILKLIYAELRSFHDNFFH
jgi:hypothetical protein